MANRQVNLYCQDVFTLLQTQAEERPDAAALVDGAGDAQLTYRQLFQEVATLASTIARACGTPADKRPRIGIALPNGMDMPVALLAACCAGVAVPFNPRHTAAEFERYFSEAGIDALLVEAEVAGPALEAAGKLGVELLPYRPEKPAQNDACIFTPPAPDDLALILLTSGSTGRQKSVPLTNRNVCASAADVCRSMDLGPSDRCLSMWEQYHIGGLVDLLLAPLASGGTVICTAGFDAAEFFRALERAKPTWVQLVPATLNELAFHARRHSNEPRPTSLRLIRSVAAALPPRLMAEAEALFGVPVIQTFGMTEAGPLITSTRLPPAVRKPGSAGTSCGTEIRVVGKNGAPLATGAQGDIAIRGPNVFSGYDNNPEANATSFRGEWFLTGDIGYLDADGDLFLTGRVKQLINRGGEKINPQEVDDVLHSHPAVHEAATFAVPHRTLGEDIAAAIVPRTPGEVADQDIRRFLSEKLSSFKVPQHILTLERLPRNPVGKIDRLALSDMASAKPPAATEPASQPPRHDLDRMLTSLWAEELDLETVGIDDDFTSLGGDSLSRLRIVLAAEAVLGFKLPDSRMETFSTVREFADVARSTKPRGAQPCAITTIDPRSILAGIDVGRTAAEDGLDTARETLLSARTRRELSAARDSITTYSTPDELTRLIQDTRPPRGIMSALSATPFASLRPAWKHRNWLRMVAREIGDTEHACNWRRRRISDNALLFEDPNITAGTKTLVVGFAGNAMRLMTATYRILLSLDPAGADLLLLRDPERAHFAKGIAGCGDDMDSVADWLETFRIEQGYRKAVTIGTSAGGLAAIYTAMRNQWPRAAAIGADNPERRALIHGNLQRAAEMQSIRNPTVVSLHYSQRNARDRSAAEAIMQMLPRAVAVPDRRFRDHVLLHNWFKAGELQAFLERQVG